MFLVKDYNLEDQIKRAAISVSLNIAEGSAKKSKIDFRRFIQISRGSLNEVVTCLYIAKNQKYISKEAFDKTYQRCEQISKMLYGFMEFLEK